uniref:MPN domain-containing protein n=1 Tax=Hemiselmis andersenii TaxID=464988 RepID=A0A6U2FEE5_HEMAN|mmetsp:Transcript_31498/g.73721  ORF Transcript_31498/g.73721 Transcript_31498/m.73721 type:complete len:231 (-) Transcript_31498:77-769(-)
MAKVHLGQVPYIVSVMHSLKHPSSSVNGVLLGQAGKSSDGTVQAHISEAIPLLHSHLSLAPALDGAFALLDEYCKARNLGVLGYYQANSHHLHNDLTPTGKRIADKIAENVRENHKWVPLVCMVVDSQALDELADLKAQGAFKEDMSGHTGVKLMLRTSGTWGPADGVEIEGVRAGVAQNTLCDEIAFAHHLDIVDFDDHLKDTSKGWLQPLLVEQGKEEGFSKCAEKYP